MKVEQEGLDYFRKAVSFLYREIGVLKHYNCKHIASKAKFEDQFFPTKRKILAKEIYYKTKKEKNIRSILKPYEHITGLTLENLYECFRDGNWLDNKGYFSFGGPKWAEIAKIIIMLGQAIDSQNIDSISGLLVKAKKLKHNNGLLADKFQEL